MQRGRRELALVALRQYEEKGFAQTTVEEIAEAADYAPSTFFRHFGTKENAVFFDIDERMNSYRALMAQSTSPGGSGWARVREVLLDNAVYWAESDPEFALARTRLCHKEPALYTRYLHYCDQVETIVRRVLAADRGTDPDDDIEAGVLAGAAVAAFRTALRVWLGEGGRVVDHLQAGLDALQAGIPSTGSG
ncbi:MULTISPECIES: TetR/AcrR family transcriptional regulator [Mycobacterium]|uniref:TetR family transcriptional regulator n=1 Tax=Mycobacterium kiyosense TaxID=2871094 RepID=A0A9P3Q975_9MYCO|nr:MULTISPECIES: TetR/AcrR family transcriptional regulator [Mycobacterium]BDB43206.1 TetR family transcriptional regulator [Mycobacterium kiyosense]BDE13592.1 TetR family transcriptional regulator [Mycobacterium sp. 20KCMC460]GLB83398.1 TetR family transcriptional regulator [Mycobacterium kiyosense]GLB91120.1 TetR family transcriptional regulator [Mycobacterium kiyosense]GLB97458.1 TetR family transcriptional regulator [Mycobacterium kiyosense]